MSCRLSSRPRKSYVDRIVIRANARFKLGSPRAQYSPGGRLRSATVMIPKRDGGMIGS